MPDAAPGLLEEDRTRVAPGVVSPTTSAPAIATPATAVPSLASATDGFPDVSGPASASPGLLVPVEPAGTPGLLKDDRAQVAPPRLSPAAAAPDLASRLTGFPGISLPGSADPGFVVTFRSTYLARTGETYVPHFDDLNAPTFAPAIQEEDLIAGASITQVNPASGEVTVYLGLFEDATETVVSLPVPTGVVASLQVRASSAPGAGKSFTYTVMKNGVAQSMTTSVTGASAQSGTTGANTVSCNVGDRISLRLVADSGASSAHHRFTMRYTVTA